jgi:fumarate hydratase class II
MADTRIERDSIGEVAVPNHRLWGAQTQRSLENFPISDERIPLDVVRALVAVKRAAALTNANLGQLATDRAQAIVAAADEVLQGLHDAEFPLSVWQTGSGTQTNMNVNEVLANRASELLGGGRGQQRKVHPNDDVNHSQSSNDTFAVAMQVAAALHLRQRLLPNVRLLRDAIEAKSKAFADVIKVGRTHLQDATPVTIGQEFSAWQTQLDHGMRRVEATLNDLYHVPLGGTAVGTGLNAHPDFADQALGRLAELVELPLRLSDNAFEAISAHDALVSAHGAIKTLATGLHKIANDVRWLASGPRCGIGELILPANEPGSSIMPGKVNPTQCEAMIMCCLQIMANDVAVSAAGASGNFQLNVARPLLIHAFLQSCRLLGDACNSFAKRAIAGLRVDRKRVASLLEQSLMLVTSLAPHIGYDAAAAIAKRAHAEGTTLRQAALADGRVSAEQYDLWVRPEAMLGPSAATAGVGGKRDDG